VFCDNASVSLIRNHWHLFTESVSSHLLGKKSWNVYNADNIAKVKQDEAAAAALEAAEEQRMQEVDAERRIQILRGIRPEEIPAVPQATADTRARDEPRRDRERRRIAGEDDTDRDLRLAREHHETASRSTQALTKPGKNSDAPLTDHQGHINLFPAEGSKHHALKNAEAEAEAAKKKKEYEDQYTMRFSSAAGFKQLVGQKPWYSSISAAKDGEDVEETVSRDVWGNEDPRRKEREKMRLVSDDPMAVIQKGVSELQQVERERRRWKEERDRELRVMVKAKKRQEGRKRRRTNDVDKLEGFSLDAIAGVKDEDRGRRHRHHRGHRSRERSKNGRSRDHRHHRHPSPSREADRQYSRHELDHSKYRHGSEHDQSSNRRSSSLHQQIPTPPDEVLP